MPLRRAQKPASQFQRMAPARDGQRKLPLTVLPACSNDVRVMQQDLFGPVLPLVAADRLHAAIAYMNDRPHPLALYLSRILARSNSRCCSPHWPAT